MTSGRSAVTVEHALLVVVVLTLALFFAFAAPSISDWYHGIQDRITGGNQAAPADAGD